MARGLRAPLSSYEFTLLMKIRKKPLPIDPATLKRFVMLKLVEVTPQGTIITELGRQRLDQAAVR